MEAFGQAIPATDMQAGEHEASMVARPNGTDQEMQNRRSLTGESAMSSVESPVAVSGPDPTLQAVPATGFEAGEHEAGMVSRASDKEEAQREEPMNVAIDDLEQESDPAGTAKGLRHDTFSEPENEEIARRAFDLYLARGQEHGHEMDDWTEAKRQLVEESGAKG